MKQGRKVFMGVAGLVSLLGGLGLCATVPSLSVAFPAFATAAVSITGLVVAGNAAEWFAKRGAP